MHLSPANSSEKADDIKSDGLLIANDSDYRRAQLLVHTTARLPTPGIMVTNLDVSNFPIIKIPTGSNDASSLTAGASSAKEPAMRQLRFHRILSDVPCSGDGTMRKNMRIWQTWSPMDGNGLHRLELYSQLVEYRRVIYRKLDSCSLQLRILQRAMRMLVFDFEGSSLTSSGTSDITVNKEKGRIVYSTCSFNPVENEAVVAAALNSVPGECGSFARRLQCSAVSSWTGYEVVDVSSQFPELERRPGLTAWQPAVDREVDMTCRTYQDYVSKLEASIAEQSNDTSNADRPKRNKVAETLWPPANATELGLENWFGVFSSKEFERQPYASGIACAFIHIYRILEDFSLQFCRGNPDVLFSPTR